MNRKIHELRKLLKKGYDDAFKEEGRCGKRADGLVEVTFSYPSIWDDDYLGHNKPEYWNIMVYSYILGPSRSHDFSGDTFGEAYEKAYKEVEGWVKKIDTTKKGKK